MALMARPRGTGAVTVAKMYRLLKAVLNTAVEDELIRRNPCKIKCVSTERSSERPTVTIERVYVIVAGSAVVKALVLLATFSGLRWGELIALRRRHLDIDGDRVVDVENKKRP
jgi:integrase